PCVRCAYLSPAFLNERLAGVRRAWDRGNPGWLTRYALMIMKIDTLLNSGRSKTAFRQPSRQLFYSEAPQRLATQRLATKNALSMAEHASACTPDSHSRR